VRPRASNSLDFEGELAAIVGRRGRHIPKAEALDFVAGYSIFNDGSVSMKPADVCEVEIEGLGILRNSIIDETLAAAAA